MNESERNFNSESLMYENIQKIRKIDPEIIESSEVSRELVLLGLENINAVTFRYGTTDRPKWSSGSYEKDVFMSYHNGGPEGHTSIGEHGVGVPRNVLMIAKAVNEAAGFDVYDPLARAIAFNAASAHDVIQLCGRSMLPEGQAGIEYGDERQSAEYARDHYIAAGGDPVIAQKLYDGVMATAFNPKTGSQNVKGRNDYENDADFVSGALNQELVAAADLLSPTSRRGPLGAFEYCVESLSLGQYDRVFQNELQGRGVSITSIQYMRSALDYIGSNDVLTGALKKIISGQSKFFKEFIHYSDTMITSMCGKGIDELFPGRIENGDVLKDFSESLNNGAKPVDIWITARRLNGEEN